LSVEGEPCFFLSLSLEAGPCLVILSINLSHCCVNVTNSCPLTFSLSPSLLHKITPCLLHQHQNRLWSDQNFSWMNFTRNPIPAFFFVSFFLLFYYTIHRYTGDLSEVKERRRSQFHSFIPYGLYMYYSTV
jgi:hypothetical protein